MKKSMLFKRICAGLLAALMVVGSDPVTVLADEPAEILEEEEILLDESEEVLLSEVDESVIENQTIAGANGEEIPTEEALAEEISVEDISIEETLIDEVSVDETLSEETLTDETSAEVAEADSDEENASDDEDMELMATYSITISTKNIAEVTYVVASDISDVKGSDVIDETVVFNGLDGNPALNDSLVISGIKAGYDVAITDMKRAGSDVLYDTPTYDGGTGPSSEKTKIGKRGSSDLFGWLVAKNVQDNSTGGRSIVSEYKAYDVKVKTNNVGAYVFVYYTDDDLETTGDPAVTDFKSGVLNSDSVEIYSAELSGVENVAHVPAGKKLAVAAIPKWMTYGTISVEYPQDGLLLEKQESNKLYSYVNTFLGKTENADIAERCNLYPEGFGLYEIGTIEHGSNPEVKITVTDISYDVTLSTIDLVDSITYMLADTPSVTVSNPDERIRTLSHSDNPNPFKTYTDNELGLKEYVTINVPKGQYLYIVDLGLPTGYSHFKDMSAWNYEDATYVEKFYTEHGKYTDDTRFEAFAFGSVNKPLHVVLNNDYYCMDVIKSVYGVTTALEFAGGYTKESESGKDVYRVVAVDPDSTATPPVAFGYENLWVKAGFGRFSLEKVKVQARAFYNKEGAGGRNERVYSDWMNLTFQSDLGDNTALFYLSGEKIKDWSTKSVKELVEDSEDPNYYTSIELRVMPTVTIDFNTKEDSVWAYLFDMDNKRIVDFDSEDTIPLTPLPEGANGRTLIDVDYAGNFAFVILPDPEVEENFDVESVKVKKGNYDKLNYWEQDGTGSEPSKYKYYQISNVTSDIVINSTLFVKEGTICCFTIDNSDCVGAPKISVTNAKFVQNNSGENIYQISQSNSQTKVTEVTVSFEAQKAYPFDLLMGSGEDLGTYSKIAPVETKDLAGNWTKYTFKFRAKDFCGSDKRLYLKEHPEEREFYLTFNARETKAKVVLTSTGVELAPAAEPVESALGGNYKVYKYWIPYMYEVAVTAEARENCKLTTGVNNKKNVNINKAAGKAVTYKYVAKDGNNSNGNDFAFYSTSLNVLRVFPDIEDVESPSTYGSNVQKYDDNFLKYPKNSYTAKVEAENANYYAYIDHGEPGHEEYSYFDFGEDDVVVKAVTAGKTEVSNEMIKYAKIVEGAQSRTRIHFDFSSEKVAGQTVTVTVTKAGVKIATLKFTVAPYAQTVTIKGEKNKTVSQEYLTTKTYKLTFNKGVNTEHTAIIPEYYGYDNKWYQFDPSVAKNYFIYDAKKAELTVKAVPGIDQRQDPDTLKNNDLPGFRVMVYDITKPSYKSHTGDEGRVDYKYFNLTLNNLAKYTPKAKVTQTSDVSVTVDFNLPSQYKDYARSMYYDVTVKSTTKNVDIPLDRQVNYVIPATEKGATLMVAHGEDHNYTVVIKEGEGHAQKYDVTVKLMCGRDYREEDDTISVGNHPYGEVADADKATLSSPNYVSKRWYGSSKNQTVKNVSTKDPYYENALTAKAGTTKLLWGQTNVKIATVKFNKKTSYHDTYCVLLPKNATSDDINAASDFHECFTSYNKNDIILTGYRTNHGKITPGEYKLLIYPYDGETIPFAYSKPAVVNLTIYQSLVGGLFSVSTPSTIYKKDNSSASMTPTITYSAKDEEGVKYEPKVKKFTWELDVSKIPEKMQKYVKINKSTGKVTIDKKFEVSATPAENTFGVIARANDYSGNTAYAEAKFNTISNVPKVITSLTLVDKADVYKTDGLNKTYTGTKNDFGKIVPSGILASDATFTSSNKKVIEIAPDGTLTVKATGKTVITVKSKDGSKSTAKMTLKVVNKAYNRLGLGVGVEYGTEHTKSLTPGIVNDEGANSFILSVGFFNGSDWIWGNGAENTSYSISVKGGKIQKIADDICKEDPLNYGTGHTYVAMFTSDRMVITLTDKTKSKKDSYYKQEFVIDFKDTAVANNKKIKVSFTKNSVGPDSETYLKITGLDKSATSYKVALVPDMFEYCSSYDTQEAYFNFLNSFDASGMSLRYSNQIKYNADIGGFVPCDNSGDPLPLKVMDYYDWFMNKPIPPIGTYKFNCYVLNSSTKTVEKMSSIKLKFTGAEKPVFDIATTYNISTVDASASDSFPLNPDSKNKNLLNLGSDYNNSTYRIARIRNANINGKLTDFTKIFEIDDERQGLKFRNDDSDYSIKEYANTVVYGYVECAYKDKLGKEYTVYKLIGVGIKGFSLN